MSKLIRHLLLSLVLCSAISCSPKTNNNNNETAITPNVSPEAQNPATAPTPSKDSEIDSAYIITEETKPAIIALDEPVDDKAIEYAEHLLQHLCNSEYVTVITNDDSEKLKARLHSANREKSLVAPNHNVFVNIQMEAKDENSEKEFNNDIWLELKKSGTEYKLIKVIYTEDSDNVLDILSDADTYQEYSLYVWDDKNKAIVYEDITTDPIIPIKASNKDKVSQQQTAKAEKPATDPAVKASPNSAT